MKYILPLLLSVVCAFGQLELKRKSIGDLAAALTTNGPSAPAPTEVQSKTYASSASSTTHTINFSSASAGNLLVVTVVGDDYMASAPSGWTKCLPTQAAEDYTGTYVIYKVAAGGETNVTATIGSSTSCCLWMGEYSNVSTLDKVVGTIGQTDPITCGPSGTTTAANAVVVACAGVSTSSGTPTLVGWITDTGFVGKADLIATVSGSLVANKTAVRIVSSAGSYTATADMSGTGTSHNSGIIAAFK